MAKVIKYQSIYGPWSVEASYSKGAYEVAQREAVKGTLVVEGEDDPVEPTEQDDVNAMLVDMEYRLTLLELGVTEEE